MEEHKYIIKPPVEEHKYTIKPRHVHWTLPEVLFISGSVHLRDEDARQLFERTFGLSISLVAYQKKRRDLNIKKRRGRLPGT